MGAGHAGVRAVLKKGQRFDPLLAAHLPTTYPLTDDPEVRNSGVQAATFLVTCEHLSSQKVTWRVATSHYNRSKSAEADRMRDEKVATHNLEVVSSNLAPAT